MGAQKKVVWVLGAGFSKSLGGPLLEELFDPHRWRYVRSLIAKEAERKNEHVSPATMGRMRRLHDLYVEAKTRDLRVPWQNAEEYLEMWESARDKKSPEHERCLDLLVNIVSEVFGAESERMSLRTDLLTSEHQGDARRYLAAITSEFMHGRGVVGEKWRPYFRWIEQLDHDNDHIITFNYDLVVERTYQECKKRPIGRTGPFKGVDSDGRKRGMLHKLHGSIDWILDGRASCIEAREVDLVAMMRDDCEVALGIPGPGKFSISADIFKPQWECAMQALEDADAIVFVGYSCPATDNYAKGELLNAIKRNWNSHLKMRLVLGPKRSEAVERLEGMLHWTVTDEKQTIRTEPMNAEDYFSVFERADLVES